MQTIQLSTKQLQELRDIEDLIVRIQTNEDVDEEIRMLSVKHKVTKAYMTDVMRNMLSEEDYLKIETLNSKIWNILEPVYEKLTNMALVHMHQWYKRLKISSGELDPNMYEYQLELANWLLGAIIKNELNDSIYTLVVSRGSGKTYTLSIVGAFLLLHWDSYILHNVSTDYVICVTAPQDDQLASFRNYINEFIDVSCGIGMVAEKESETSELDLVRIRKNVKEIGVNRENGAKFGTIYFRLGASSVEGIHANLTLNDESKFLKKKDIETSILPTVGGRSGSMVMLSSAHNKWSQFQEYVKKNKKDDISDHAEYGTRLIKTGSETTRNLCFNGRRHFEQHWERMIQHNSTYAQTVNRALNITGREDESFATQYDNLFLADKTSSFYDIETLKNLGAFVHKDFYSYVNNANYVIIAGFDPAVTDDNSSFTMKALDNGYGVSRKSVTLLNMVLNTSRDKTIDSIYNQCKTVADLVKIYNISALSVDESGVGKSACDYIMENLKRDRYTKLLAKNLIPVVFNQHTRIDCLEFYYKRIQAGLENFALQYDEKWNNEDEMAIKYVKLKDDFSDKACWFRFVFEHSKFARNEIMDEKAGMTKITFEQSYESFLHDDTIFSSSLASYCLNKNPSVHRIGDKVNLMKTGFGARSSTRWGNLRR